MRFWFYLFLKGKVEPNVLLYCFIPFLSAAAANNRLDLLLLVVVILVFGFLDFLTTFLLFDFVFVFVVKLDVEIALTDS